MTEKYAQMVRDNRKTRLPKGTLVKTIADIVKRRELPCTTAATIMPESIKSRSRRDKHWY